MNHVLLLKELTGLERKRTGLAAMTALKTSRLDGTVKPANPEKVQVVTGTPAITKIHTRLHHDRIASRRPWQRRKMESGQRVSMPIARQVTSKVFRVHYCLHP
jgi:hypothetical protein